MKKIILFSLLLCTVFVQVFATNQYPDRITYKSRTYVILSIDAENWNCMEFPLESYLKKNNLLSYNWRTEEETVNEMKLIHRVHSTANIRGYTADWKILDGKLFLMAVYIPMYRYKEEKPSNRIPLSEIQKDWKSPIFADWYTHTVLLMRNPSPFPEIIEDFLGKDDFVLTIQSGTVISEALAKNIPAYQVFGFVYRILGNSNYYHHYCKDKPKPFKLEKPETILDFWKKLCSLKFGDSPEQVRKSGLRKPDFMISLDEEEFREIWILLQQKADGTSDENAFIEVEYKNGKLNRIYGKKIEKNL